MQNFLQIGIARMLAMERENKELRETMKQVLENQQLQCGRGGSSHTRQQPSQPSLPTVRTEATRLPTAGERKRVARQPAASQRERGGRVGRSLGKTTDTETSCEGKGQRAVDRGIADDIIRQRQEDEQSNVITEQYSRLRIK